MNTNRFLVYVALLALLAALLGSVGATCADDLHRVTIGRWGDVNTFDPAVMTSVEREFTILNCIFNGLVKYKPGTWEVVPDVAKSWDVSDDQKTITFYLRKGVQFHKGYGELTAEDVKFSFERILSKDLDSPYASDWSFLDYVEIVDDYTVKLVLKNPAARLFTSTLPMNPGFIVSKEAVTDMGREKFSTQPIGSGPFQFDHWSPKEEVSLKAFDEYWDEKTEFKELIFKPIPETSTLEMALRAGELDVGRVSLKNVEQFEKNDNLTVHLNPGLKYWWIGMTVNQPPFEKLAARKAVRYAVDVSQLIQAAFFGYAERACTVLPPGMLGHWEDAPCYEQDLEKAKAFLKEAGYPDGFKTSCYIWSSEKARIIAEVLQSQLRQVGIDMEIKELEVGAFNETSNLGKTDMHVQFFATTLDPGYATQWFTCDRVGKKYGWNAAQWCSKEYDKLWGRAESMLDQEKRADLYVKMQKLIDESAWAIWLTNGVRATVNRNSLDLGELYPNGSLAPWLISTSNN